MGLKRLIKIAEKAIDRKGGTENLSEDDITKIVSDVIKERDRWIPLSEKLPEDFDHLIVEGESEPEQTKRVLVKTDTNDISDNIRLKMMVGEKEWVWLMSYEGAEIIEWRELEIE